MPHPVLTPGAVAIITGGASGIGLAAAAAFARLGLEVCIADLPGDRLDQAAATLGVMAHPTDVTSPDDLRALQSAVQTRFGRIDVLMNNAGIQPGSTLFGADDVWTQILDTNLRGIIRGTQIIAPAMIASNRPGLIINTGSKQGITTPPGDPAYNVAKAGVKAFTEALQHTLRTTEGCRVTAHLLIPGFVFTPLTANGRTERPAAAWTPDQTVAFMLERLDANDFYILCPDNDVARATDERRILWAAGDIVENRPPLSRWHPDYAAAAKRYIDPS
jgi:NAD(P)-dependent dehydrogenase (short-subunit alcohol dehydrogenase family)